MAFVINWLKPTLLGLGLSAASIYSAAIQAGWFDDDPLSGAADLRYGAALYEFYQDKNLEALSELMVAEARGGIQGHGDNPEIMAGGFYMAYGMKNVATDIFNRLLDQNRPVRTRDAAWFYLARLKYLQGDFTGAADVMTHLSEKPHRSIANDVKVLRFNLALQNKDFETARTFLKDKTLSQSDWQPYLLYNMGAAFSRDQQWPEAVQYFSALTQMRERSDEHMALYDKAMTAEGYSYLFNKNYQQAIAGFSKVRLDSPLASRALLGYGWAAFELEDYNRALQPWQVLAKKPLVDENVQESWVAIPIVYEKLGYTSVALEQYRTAEAAFASEIQRLDQTLANMKGNAIRSALNIDRSEDFNWLNYAAENEMAPELVYLIQVFSTDQFLRSVQELRDLLAVQNNLAMWQTKLDLYNQMLDERAANRARDVDAIQQQSLNEKIDALRQQRDALQAVIHQQQSQPNFLDMVALEQTKRRERILNAQKNAQLLQAAAQNGATVMEPEELNLLTETVRLHKGLLQWQSAQMHAERLTRAQKHLNIVNSTLEQMQQTAERIHNIASQGFDLTPYRTKIETAEGKLLWQTSSVEIAINNAQDALRNQVRETLLAERKRLMHYLGQARLSIARLLDKASEEVLYSDPKAATGSAETPVETSTGETQAGEAQADETQTSDTSIPAPVPTENTEAP